MNERPRYISEAMWEQAKRHNPNPKEMVPTPVDGFAQLTERVKLQNGNISTLKDHITVSKHRQRESYDAVSYSTHVRERWKMYTFSFSLSLSLSSFSVTLTFTHSHSPSLIFGGIRFCNDQTWCTMACVCRNLPKRLSSSRQGRSRPIPESNSSASRTSDCGIVWCWYVIDPAALLLHLSIVYTVFCRAPINRRTMNRSFDTVVLFAASVASNLASPIYRLLAPY
jgi:hypothetical protein